MLETVPAFLVDLPRDERAFRRGEAVFHLGDAVRRVFCVREGVVHLIRHQREGSGLVLQRAGPGAILAEASLYSTRYHCDARAETAAATWSVSRADLRRRIAESRDLSEAWAYHLAGEVQQARLRAEILSLKTVSERIDAWIAWNGGTPAKGRGVLVAMEIGVTPEALYREMARRRDPDVPAVEDRRRPATAALRSAAPDAAS